MGRIIYGLNTAQGATACALGASASQEPGLSAGMNFRKELLMMAIATVFKIAGTAPAPHTLPPPKLYGARTDAGEPLRYHQVLILARDSVRTQIR